MHPESLAFFEYRMGQALLQKLSTFLNYYDTVRIAAAPRAVLWGTIPLTVLQKIREGDL